jgi:hypothetical protein
MATQFVCARPNDLNFNTVLHTKSFLFKKSFQNLNYSSFSTNAHMLSCNLKVKIISDSSSQNSCLGSMTVDIERSKYRGQNCFFVNLCTNINRRGLEHSCFVSSFVGLDLDTLEERRLIVSRGSQLPVSSQGDTIQTSIIIQ